MNFCKICFVFVVSLLTINFMAASGAQDLSIMNFGSRIYEKGVENPKLTIGIISAILAMAGLIYLNEKEKQVCHDNIVILSEKPTIIGYLCTQYLLIEVKIRGMLSYSSNTKTEVNKEVLKNLIAERDKIETAILAIYKKENSFFSRLKSIFIQMK